MPSTLSGLALFAALLVPGFVYLEHLESRQPGHEYTTLRETGQVLLASLLADGFVLVLFGLIRAVAPGLTPDAGALVRVGGDFFRTHYREFVSWGAAGLVLSCLFAKALAVPPAWYCKLIGRFVHDPDSALRKGIARRRQTVITHQSGWGKAFGLYADRVHMSG